MADGSNNGLSAADVAAMIAQATSGTPAFVNSGVAMPVADLLTNFPAGASNLYRYARVTDLYGQANSVMVCEASNGLYYWRPQRADFANSSAATGGTVTLTPLVTAPILFLTGSLLSNMTITPSATNAWPGATFTVVNNGVLNLLGININNLIGGGTVPLLSGGSRIITYVQNLGWRAG